MTTGPVHRTDQVRVLSDHEDRLGGLERNVFDPRAWIYVAVAASAWSNVTAYSPGDLVQYGSPAVTYQAVAGNTNKEPDVNPADWAPLGPPFQNGFTNVGGARVPMRYRFLRTGDPALLGTSTNPNSIEIQGAVFGGSSGQTIFQLLEPAYLPNGNAAWKAVTRDKDVHLPACDSAGSFVVLTVLANGNVVYGFV